MPKNVMTQGTMAYAKAWGDANGGGEGRTLWSTFDLSESISDADRENGDVWLDRINANISLLKEPAATMIKVDGKPPRYVADKTGKFFNLVRSDTYEIIAQVASRFQPFQPRDNFRVLNAVSDQFGMRVKTAGLIDNGAKLWICADLPDYEVNGGIHNRNLFIWSPNDGTGNWGASGVDTDVRCWNTLAMARNEMKKNEDAVMLRHVASDADAFTQKINEAIVKIQIALGWFETTKAKFEIFAGKSVTNKMAQGLFDNVLFPMPAEKELKFVTDSGADMTVATSDKEPLLVRRRNEAQDVYNSIWNEESQKRGFNGYALASAATGYVQYGKRMSNSRTDIAIKRMLDNVDPNAKGVATKYQAMEWIGKELGIKAV